jgi:hypothetical protein
MPPKAKEVKKEEEVVDLSSMPSWTRFIVALVYHPYLDSSVAQEMEGML